MKRVGYVNNMGRFTKKAVFTKYKTDFNHKLAQKAYAIYKAIRISFAKRFPLDENEKYSLYDIYLKSQSFSEEMPVGYDYINKQTEKGFVKLNYIDFYDFLPKEDATKFKKSLRRFAVKNGTPKFSFFRSNDDNRIDQMGQYIDVYAFSRLYDVKLSRNEYLNKYTHQITISIHNLSASFLAVKYRIYISKAFNDELDCIFNKKYKPYTDITQQFNVPWYKPWKFGKSLYSGNQSRQKEIYIKLSEFKWEVYKELKKYLYIYFAHNQIFPPTFLSFDTNIRPNSKDSISGFWSSLGFDRYNSPCDYSQQFNLCILWDDSVSVNEGECLSALCGGDYSLDDGLPEIAKYDISDNYCTYMVANTIRRVAIRDIELYNKRISKAIRKARSFNILKTRTIVEKKLYYCYRFMSEFTGESINISGFNDFYCPLLKNKSISELNLSRINLRISETKGQIDTILNLLNDSAEFQSSKTNMSLQRKMIIIAFFTLILTVITLLVNKKDLLELWKSIRSFFGKIFY